LLYLVATTPHLKNYVEICSLDVPWCSRVPFVVSYHTFWGLHIGGVLPRVVLMAKPFPLDKILELLAVPMAVQQLFYFPLFLSIYNNQWWWWVCSMSWDWIFQGGG